MAMPVEQILRFLLVLSSPFLFAGKSELKKSHSIKMRLRACLKNAFCKMCITICGRFRLNEGGVAGYGNRMKAKYTVN